MQAPERATGIPGFAETDRQLRARGNRHPPGSGPLLDPDAPDRRFSVQL